MIITLTVEDSELLGEENIRIESEGPTRIDELDTIEEAAQRLLNLYKIAEKTNKEIVDALPENNYEPEAN